MNEEELINALNNIIPSLKLSMGLDTGIPARDKYIHILCQMRLAGISCITCSAEIGSSSDIMLTGGYIFMTDDPNSFINISSTMYDILTDMLCEWLFDIVIQNTPSRSFEDGGNIYIELDSTENKLSYDITQHVVSSHTLCTYNSQDEPHEEPNTESS